MKPRVKRKLQKGMTLIELVVASTISILVLLLSFGGIQTVLKQMDSAKRRVSFKENHYLFDKVVKRYFEHAINVEWVKSGIKDIGSGKGKIRQYKSALSTKPNAAPIVIGVFLREVGAPGGVSDSGDIRATGIYFKRPTLLEGGELIFTTSKYGQGNVTLSSHAPVFKVDSLVEFEITNGVERVNVGSPVKSLKIKMVRRRYTSGEKKSWKWCPSKNISKKCRTTASAVDEETVLRLNLSNNVFVTGVSDAAGSEKKETIYGDLYMFPLLQKER